MTTYYLRGKIEDDFFMIGTDQENNSYIYCNPSNVPFDQSKTAGFYDISTQNTPVDLGYDKTLIFQNFFMFQNPDSTIGYTTTVIDSVTLKPKEYNLDTKNLYTGVIYNAYYKGKLVTFPIITDDSVLYNIKNIRFVPYRYFFEEKTCIQKNSLIEEKKWISDPITYTGRGFTTLQDCKNKTFYNYCKKNEFCGDNNCYGDFSLGHCSWSNGHYPEFFFEEKKKSDYIWLIIFVVILLFIILGFVLSIIRRK